jgi:nucleoid DNA-binding protein
MSNLTKRDLIIRISNETGLVHKRVQRVIDQTLHHIASSLAHGQAIELRNFGRFEVKLRKVRIVRNRQCAVRDVPIPYRAVVKFKAGKVMKSSVLTTLRDHSAASQMQRNRCAPCPGTE